MKSMSIALALALVALGAATTAYAATGPQDVVDCTKKAVRDLLQGTPQPCPIADAASSDGPKEIVDCVRYAAYQTITGNPIEPCAVQASAGPDLVECTKKAVRDFLQGTPQPCPVQASASPDPKTVVECTKKAVRDFLQGTPQPCPI